MAKHSYRVVVVITVAAIFGVLPAPSHADEGPVFMPGSGHAYELVAGATSFVQARSVAASREFQGMSGHLVTITSAAEMDFVNSLAGGNAYFLGARDIGPLGSSARRWAWTDGPESGTVFTTCAEPEWADGGSGCVNTPGFFSAWTPGGEPTGGAETYAVVGYAGRGTWTDCTESNCDGPTTAVVVEYEEVTALPLPTEEALDIDHDSVWSPQEDGWYRVGMIGGGGSGGRRDWGWNAGGGGGGGAYAEAEVYLRRGDRVDVRIGLGGALPPGECCDGYTDGNPGGDSRLLLNGEELLAAGGGGGGGGSGEYAFDGPPEAAGGSGGQPRFAADVEVLRNSLGFNGGGGGASDVQVDDHHNGGEGGGAANSTGAGDVGSDGSWFRCSENRAPKRGWLPAGIGGVGGIGPFMESAGYGMPVARCPLLDRLVTESDRELQRYGGGGGGGKHLPDEGGWGFARIELVEATGAVQMPGTNRWFGFIPGKQSWQDSRLASRDSKWLGVAGHLATLGTPQENEVASSLLQSLSAANGRGIVWIGARNVDGDGRAGTFGWVEGDESGTSFLQCAITCQSTAYNRLGSDVNGTYPAEGSQIPSDDGPYVALDLRIAADAIPSGGYPWLNAGDAQSDMVSGYLVEYDVPQSAPSAPRAFMARPGAESVTLSWQAPRFDGGSSITGYRVMLGAQTVCATTTDLSCVVGNLSNGTSYEFRVSAINATGASASGSVAATPRTTPGAVTNVSVYAGDSALTIYWNPPASDGGARVIGYAVTGADGRGCASTTETTCVVSGLSNGSAYTFTITALNAAGAGPGTDVTATPVWSRFGRLPAVPPGFSCSQASASGEDDAAHYVPVAMRFGGSFYSGMYVTTNGALTFGWPDTAYSRYPSAPSISFQGRDWVTDGSGVLMWGIKGRNICVQSYARPYGGGDYQAFRVLLTLAPDGIHGRIHSSAGYATRRAVRYPSGELYGIGDSFTLDGGSVSLPTAPQGLSAEAGDASVLLSWQPPAEAGNLPILGYTVSDSWGNSCETQGDTSCQVEGLQNGEPYSFTVRAMTEGGYGAPSDAVTATPRTVPSAPLLPWAEKGDTRATISWQPPQFDGGAAITTYTVHATPGGATCSTPTLSCTINGLANRVSYRFTVSAVNAAGAGELSASTNEVMPLAPGFQGWPLQQVVAAGSAATFRFAQAAAGASIATSGVAKTTMTADAEGFASTTFTVPKAGIHKLNASYSVKVGKKTTKYSTVAQVYAPSTTGPSAKIKVGKSGTFKAVYAPPGAIVMALLSDGRTITATADAAGKAALTAVFPTVGAVTYAMVVSGVQTSTGGITISR